MAQLPPISTNAPPPFFVEHLFFKSFPELSIPSTLTSQDTPSSSTPWSSATSPTSLCSSSKHGVILVGGQEKGGVAILRVSDVLDSRHSKKGQGQDPIPFISVVHPRFGSTPTIVSISSGSDQFVGMDTIREAVPFVLIFSLEHFITLGSKCEPVVEVRASFKEGTFAKVSGICWNPGENMGNMLAISCDDGSLIAVTIKGVNTVEMVSYKDSCVRSMCWSPKGKQLVVGKADGSLCQLKLDLTEAKKIPGPGQGKIPSAVFWSATTQFLVNFVVDRKDIDLMQLDLPKGSPPIYTSFGDAFISDRVDAQASCCFIPILPWNVVICASNTINDLIVMGKGLHENNSGENWIIADLNDNRRAALPIDSFAVGASIFLGNEAPVTFNETESYGPVPVVFALSEAGTLASFAFVNSKADAPSLFQKVSHPLPPALFAHNEKEVIKGIIHSTPVSVPPQGTNMGGVGAADGPAFQPQPFQMPLLQSTGPGPTVRFELPSGSKSGTSNLNTFGGTAQANLPKQETPGFNFTLPSTPPTTIKLLQETALPETVTTASIAPSGVLPTTIKQQSLLDMMSLPTTGLPTLQQVGDLKRIVEEKRAQGGFRDVDDSEEPDMDELCLEVEKFQKRLELHHKRRTETEQQTQQSFNQLRTEYEHEVLTPLNLMEDFVATLKETKDIQIQEVNGIKERILSHYTELEYAKALAERNKDPKYVQLLMAQTMDSGRAKKFNETEKLYHYIKNQSAECERFFKLQNQQPLALQNAAALQSIYQTLSNHSKIMQKLAHKVNSLRCQLGLIKTPGIEGSRIFEIPTMGHNYYEKKPLLKERPTITVHKSAVPKIKAEREQIRDDRITLDDLTAGMSRVKLNKLRESDQEQYSFLEQKPMRISAKKLESLTAIVSKIENIEINPAKDMNSFDPFDISVKNRARSRNLINKLDDTPLPFMKKDNYDEETKLLASTPEPYQNQVPATTVSSVLKPIAAKPQQSSPLVVHVSSATSSTGSIALDVGKPGFQVGKLSPSEAAPTLVSMLSPRSTATPTPTPQMPISSSNQEPRPLLINSNTASSFGFKSTSPSLLLIPGSIPVPPVNKPEFGTAKIAPTLGPASTTSSLPILAVSSSSSNQTRTVIPLASSTAAQFGFTSGITSSFSTIPSTTTATNITGLFGSNTPIPAFNFSDSLFSSAAVAPIDSENNSSASVSALNVDTKSVSGFGLGGLTLSGANPSPVAATTPKVRPTTPVSIQKPTPAEPPSLAITASSVLTSTQSLATTQSTSIFGNAPNLSGISVPAFSSSIFNATPTPTPLSTSSPKSLATTAATQSSTVGSVENPLPANLPFFDLGLTGFKLSTSAPSTTSTSATTTSTTSSISTLSFPSVLPEVTPAPPTIPKANIFGASTTISGSVTTAAAPASTPTSTSLFGGLVGQPIVGFGSPTTASSLFGAIPTSTSAFGSAPIFGGGPALVSQSAFGGTSSSVFGSSGISSTFGSAFGSASPGGASTFGGFGSPNTASVFGGTPPSTQPTQAFASSPFGGGVSTFAAPSPFEGTPSSASAFGSSSSSITGSTFGSTFGSSTPAAGSGSIFGGGQTGSGFGSPAPALAPSVFGNTSPPSQAFGSAPVFGSSPAFGGSPAFGSSGSTFGSAFGSTSPAASGGGSIFGGGSVQQSAPSFGALAQAAPPVQQGFGSFGSPVGGQQQGSLFGGGQPSSPFGQQQQQQTSPFGGAATNSPSFGGSAFSSWR